MPFRLGDKDRARYGLPEWIDYSPYSITLADIQELSERFDFDATDWPDPYLGQITLEQAGDPDAKAKPPKWRNWAWAWMLLRQNGVDASWADAGTVFFYEIQFKPADAAAPSDVEPGKDASPPSTASRSSGSSTTRRSSTSTASRKSKSTS